MMRCIAIDDEKLALDLLEDNIKRVPFLQLVARCKNALEAAEVLKTEQVDLLFLDIQMPGITGLQFLQNLSEPPMAIMVTAYSKYAISGFDLDVVDYLVKPVPFERFLKACNKANELFQLKQQQQQQGELERTYFFVNVEYSQVRINYDQILFIEGMKDYIKIHLLNSQRPVITRLSMKTMEEKLSGRPFIRVHKSFIVATDKINTIKRGLVVLGSVEIPVSDSYKGQLEQALGIQPE